MKLWLEVLEEEMVQAVLSTPNPAVQPFPERMREALPSALSSPGPSGPRQGNQVPEFQVASFVPFLPFLVLCRERDWVTCVSSTVPALLGGVARRSCRGLSDGSDEGQR